MPKCAADLVRIGGVRDEYREEVATRRSLDSAKSEYVTVREVAERYRLSLSMAYAIAHGLPNTLRLGRCVRVWRPDLEKLEREEGGVKRG